MKNIDETINYFLEEIEQNELMSRKHKKVYATLNYIEDFLRLASAIAGCISISAFASLIGIPIGIATCAIGLKICAIAAGINTIRINSSSMCNKFSYSKENNERKSVVAERFIRTLKNKIYKYMTSISKNVYIDKLDGIVTKYSNIYQSTIKKKPADVKSNTYINSSKGINDKNPKIKIGDIVCISKYKNIFAKVCNPN